MTYVLWWRAPTPAEACICVVTWASTQFWVLHSPGPDDVVGHLQQPGYRIVGVVDGVDADDRVAGAVGQSLVNGGPDAFGRIGWVVGLVAAA